MSISTEPLIRPYREEDRAAVIALVTGQEPWRRLGYTAADWQRIFSAASLSGREAWVIESGGATAGIAVVRRNFLLGDYLELFAIAAGARRSGLGKILLGDVERRVFARTKNFFVCVSDFNSPARRFYEQCGYREIGPIPDLLIEGAAEILLRKSAGPARGR